VPALSLGELGGGLGRWAKGGAKMDQTSNCVVQKVTNVHQGKVNGSHVQAVYEKIEVLLYFRFAAEGIIFFHINFSFPYAR